MGAWELEDPLLLRDRNIGPGQATPLNFMVALQRGVPSPSPEEEAGFRHWVT